MNKTSQYYLTMFLKDTTSKDDVLLEELSSAIPNNTNTCQRYVVLCFPQNFN